MIWCLITYQTYHRSTSNIEKKNRTYIYLFNLSIENRMLEYDKDKNGTISFPEVNIHYQKVRSEKKV